MSLEYFRRAPNNKELNEMDNLIDGEFLKSHGKVGASYIKKDLRISINENLLIFCVNKENCEVVGFGILSIISRSSEEFKRLKKEYEDYIYDNDDETIEYKEIDDLRLLNPQEGDGSLSGICIKKECRNQGIGMRITELRLQIAKEKKCEYVRSGIRIYEENPGMLPIYLKLEFTQVSIHHCEYEDDAIMILVSKKL